MNRSQSGGRPARTQQGVSLPAQHQGGTQQEERRGQKQAEGNLNGRRLLQAQPGGGWGGDPKQRADMQTQLMTDSLALSEAQSAKVGEINLKYAQKMQDAREGATAAGDWESMRATMQTMRAEQDKELQTVMTQDQWQSWTQIRETLRAQRGGPGGRQPGAPPAKEKPEGGDKTKGKSKSAGN